MTWDVFDPEYQEWLNGMFDHVPESYDGGDAAEAILPQYVADLEALVGWLLDNGVHAVRSDDDGVNVEFAWPLPSHRAAPDECHRILRAYEEAHSERAEGTAGEVNDEHS